MRRGFFQHDRGASAVEFALVLPILLFILLATVEFGRAFYLQAGLSGFAREAVREYAIHGSVSAAKDRVTARAPIEWGINNGNISVTPDPCPPNGTATVVITKKFNSLTGVIEGLLGLDGKDVLNLKGEGVMRCGG